MQIELIDLDKYTPIYPKYRCMECEYEWKSNKFGPVRCIECNNNYVEWLNVKESLNSIGV